jgi:hypothetical protein
VTASSTASKSIILTAYQKRTLTARGSGPNKRTPLSYQDPYFGDGGADVNFRVQNIIERASRNGSLHTQGRVEATRCGSRQDRRYVAVLGQHTAYGTPHPRELLGESKHDIAQEVAAKKAEVARDQRLATAQAEVKAARTRASLNGVGGQSPLLLLGSQRLSRSRASSSSAGATALDETASGDNDNAEGNQSQATFPLVWRCLFQTHPLSALFQVY